MITKYISINRAAIVAGALVLLSACSFPFEETISAGTITLSENQGYLEVAVDIDEEARDPRLNYSTIEFSYTVVSRNLLSDAQAVEVAIYVSSDEQTDDQREAPDASFEEVFRVTVNSNTDTSGAAESELMVDILNDRQESFVVAANIENDGFISTVLGSDGTIDIDITLHITGNVIPF